MAYGMCLVWLAIAGSVSAESEVAALYAEMAASQDASKAVMLAERGEAGLPYLLKGLEAGGRIAALCAWALEQHPQPAVSARLRELLWQPDQVAGYWAARALGRTGDPENAAALARLLPDERLGFWELAAGGVPRLTDINVRGQRMAVPAPDWMPNLRVAYAAMESLGELGGDLARDTLLRALENDQYLIRYGAVRGLGRMRCAEAISPLARLSDDDPVLLVREAARRALDELAGRQTPAPADPSLPPAIAFIKTSRRTESNLGFRESYFFPKTDTIARKSGDCEHQERVSSVDKEGDW